MSSKETEGKQNARKSEAMALQVCAAGHDDSYVRGAETATLTAAVKSGEVGTARQT